MYRDREETEAELCIDIRRNCLAVNLIDPQCSAFSAILFVPSTTATQASSLKVLTPLLVELV